MAKDKIRMRKWRAKGHKHKSNKKSVAERKRIKKLLDRWRKNHKDKLLSEYYHNLQKQAGYGL